MVTTDVVQRIQTEYMEMPGLKLTLPQAARLFGTDASESRRALAALIDEGFLRVNPDGAYVRQPCPKCS